MAAVTTEPLAFQDLILTLHKYWGDQGCAILQPYDIEVARGPAAHLVDQLHGSRIAPPRLRKRMASPCPSKAARLGSAAFFPGTKCLP